MSKRPKKPPRYVPTLTEVLTEEWALADAAPDVGNGEAQAKKAETAVLVPDLPAMQAVQAVNAHFGLAVADLPVFSSVVPSDSGQDLPQERSAEPEAPADALQAALAASFAQAKDPDALPAGPIGARSHWLPDALEEAVVHRVMQRVDIGLDQRLRDAIATVVQEQTRSLLPRLREEVESVVRQVVYEAVADEVAYESARKIL